MAIKAVHYLNPAFTKSNHIAKKKKKKRSQANVQVNNIHISIANSDLF